jgi:predicted PurR-regulated permease PerM
LKKTLANVALVLTTLTGVYLVWQLRSVLVLLLLALALAAAMRRPIDSLVDHGMRRGLAIVGTYLVGLGLFAALLYGMGSSLIVEAQAAGVGFTTAWEQIRSTWPAGSPLQQFVAQQIPQPEEFYQALQSAVNLQTVETGLGFTLGIVDALSRFVLVLALSIYWSIDRDRFERLLQSMLQAERRIRARSIWQGIEEGVGAHIRSTVIVLVVTGLLLSAGYRLMGLDAPVTLAVMAAVCGLIPLLGWALALIPAALVGLIAGPAMSVFAALYTAVVVFALKTWVLPRLAGPGSSSHMLTIVVMLILADVLGILGLILAVPLAAIIRIVVSELLAPSAPTAVLALGSLPSTLPMTQYTESINAVHAQVQAAEGRLSPTQLSMVERLTRLSNEAHLILQDKG